MRDDMFQELMESVKEAGQIHRGERQGKRTTAADLGLIEEEVRAARERLGLSRAKFAALMGIPPRTLEGWEQGRREPEGAARVLLAVTAAYPQEVLEVVARMKASASSRKKSAKPKRRMTAA